MPEGQQDNRLQHRYKQLLEPPLTTVKVTDTSHNEGNTPNGRDNASPNEQDDDNDDDDDDNSPEPDAPFTDPDLQALWTTAIKEDKSFKRIRKTVIERARKFPRELKLQVSISECDIDNLGRLQYRERIWIPAYEPLCTKLVQQTHDSTLTGHPGRDIILAVLSQRFFWPGIS